MPITKDAFLRYRILDKCFRNTAVQYQIGDLVKKCNEELDKSVSRRTIYYDIEYMQSLDGWEAPIEIVKDGNRRYYRYSDPKFSIDKMPLSEAQLKQLQSSLDLVKTIAGLPQFESLDYTYSKIGLITYNTKAEPCVSLDHNEYVEGQRHIPKLFNAIQYQTVVKIKYKPFDKEPAEYKFHPQFLKQYNNRWYIFGITDDNPDQIWNFALDRIQKIKSTKLPYKKIDVEWKTYFEDIIGVTNYADKPVEEVHFIVHGKSAYYIKTKPIHESQIARWIDKEDNTLDVKLNVKINPELEHLLLSYADSITILSPQSLIDRHIEALKEALGRYVEEEKR